MSSHRSSSGHSSRDGYSPSEYSSVFESPSNSYMSSMHFSDKGYHDGSCRRHSTSPHPHSRRSSSHHRHHSHHSLHSRSPSRHSHRSSSHHSHHSPSHHHHSHHSHHSPHHSHSKSRHSHSSHRSPSRHSRSSSHHSPSHHSHHSRHCSPPRASSPFASSHHSHSKSPPRHSSRHGSHHSNELACFSPIRHHSLNLPSPFTPPSFARHGHSTLSTLDSLHSDMSTISDCVPNFPSNFLTPSPLPRDQHDKEPRIFTFDGW